MYRTIHFACDCRGALAAAALLACASLAQAEDSAPPPSVTPDTEQQAPPAPAPALPTPPEVMGAIGRFIDQSISTVGGGVSAGVKGAGETLGATTNAAGDLAKGVTDAAGSVTRLPTGMVEGKQRCVTAANGAPDCEAASAFLCRAKGFAQGRSVDITTSRRCPSAVWLQNRTPTDFECPNESFVVKAACQ